MYLRATGVDQIILECKGKQCISAGGVGVSFQYLKIKVKEDVFSLLVGILNKQK